MTTELAKHEFEVRVAGAWQPADWCETHVLLAVSGGPDSVALLRAVHSLKKQVGGRGRLFVGHLNHGMRAVDADADQNWLAELCERLGLPLETSAADVAGLAAQQGDGLEAAARTARYDFLRQTAARVGARWIATGHTLDDQVETVVHRIIRGTGLAGLAGTRPARPLSSATCLIRPMLAMRRSEVLAYLSAIGQEFRTDATNADDRFTRNRLRHQLLPLLRAEFNAEFDDAIMRLSEQAAEAQAVIEFHAAELAAKCVEIDWPEQLDRIWSNEVESEMLAIAVVVRIDLRLLVGQPPLLVREICRAAWRTANWPLQAMGFDEWQRLEFLVAESEDRPQINLPGNIVVRRTHGLLLLTNMDAKSYPTVAAN
jgi:tRNA(Ile)-lysidine synthase